MKLFYSSFEQSSNFFPPEVYGGSIVVKPPAEVFDEGFRGGNTHWWLNFLGSLPILVIYRSWLIFFGVNKGIVEVKMNKPMVLRKWEPNLQRLDFSLDNMLIWVQLSRVPLKLFTQKGFSCIASAFGTPLYMDNITTLQHLAYTKCRSFSHSGKHYSKKNAVKVWRVKQDGAGTAQISVPEKSVAIRNESAPNGGAALTSTFEVSSKDKAVVVDLSPTLKLKHVCLAGYSNRFE
ncbi:hypothetical protein Goshw_020184, partial [Gossypium schwendimanii]|nr:hypothetical protein [Gossypium schwendimanii]